MIYKDMSFRSYYFLEDMKNDNKYNDRYIFMLCTDLGGRQMSELMSKNPIITDIKTLPRDCTSLI